MCEICTFDELENCNTIDTNSVKTGLGAEGRLHVTLWAEKDDYGAHMMHSTLENEHGEILAKVGFLMNYCPKCGKKLNP